MDFWKQILIIVLIVVAVKYIRALIKRLILLYKMKKLCNQKDFKIYPTHPLWIFGNSFMKRCDFHIETPDEIVSVKLFGSLRRFRTLILTEKNRYFYRYFIGIFSYVWGGIFFPVDTKEKFMPTYDFKRGFKNEWENKKSVQVLLVNPVSIETRLQKIRKQEIVLNPRDSCLGMMFSNATCLLDYLNKIA